MENSVKSNRKPLQRKHFPRTTDVHLKCWNIWKPYNSLIKRKGLQNYYLLLDVCLLSTVYSSMAHERRRTCDCKSAGKISWTRLKWNGWSCCFRRNVFKICFEVSTWIVKRLVLIYWLFSTIFNISSLICGEKVFPRLKKKLIITWKFAQLNVFLL